MTLRVTMGSHQLLVMPRVTMGASSSVYIGNVTGWLQLGGGDPGWVFRGYNRTVDQITINVETCAESGTLVASWDDPRGGGLTTQAENLSELEKNIREAVGAHFDSDEVPSRVRLHFVNDPLLVAA